MLGGLGACPPENIDAQGLNLGIFSESIYCHNLDVQGMYSKALHVYS